jgi:hypothetical protein
VIHRLGAVADQVQGMAPVRVDREVVTQLHRREIDPLGDVPIRLGHLREAARVGVERDSTGAVRTEERIGELHVDVDELAVAPRSVVEAALKRRDVEIGPNVERPAAVLRLLARPQPYRGTVDGKPVAGEVALDLPEAGARLEVGGGEQDQGSVPEERLRVAPHHGERIVEFREHVPEKQEVTVRRVDRLGALAVDRRVDVAPRLP